MDELKRTAAEGAVARYVQSGMVVGLGSGSTAAHVVRRIGELLSSGELGGVTGIPTSSVTAGLAQAAGIPLTTLAETRPRLTIDGTDEISPSLDLIKGHGGALLREKIVAAASEDGLVVVADETKRVASLGVTPLPVEVEPFGWQATVQRLEALGCTPELRMDGPMEPFVTDGGHYTVDCRFASIEDPGVLEAEIRRIPGALECGLFVGLTLDAIIATAGGTESLGAT